MRSERKGDRMRDRERIKMYQRNGKIDKEMAITEVGVCVCVCVCVYACVCVNRMKNK